ncbi:MAG: HDOD domain-containing protein, partial [Acidobacteria bacterium]|nr:HDOD domain-containing protein [Acidobacteriota bacterium]
MVAGLLCDLGELLLQETFPEQYLTVLNAGTERHWKEQCARETAEFGVDHAEVGAYCLARWKLGEELTGAIRWHHQPSSGPLGTLALSSPGAPASIHLRMISFSFAVSFSLS